jgi:hypothetical protein
MKKVLLLMCLVGFHTYAAPQNGQRRLRRRYSIPLNDTPQARAELPPLPIQPTIEIDEPPAEIFFAPVVHPQQDTAYLPGLGDDEGTDNAPRILQEQSNDVQKESHVECTIGKVLLTTTCIVLIEYILNYWGQEQHS